MTYGRTSVHLKKAERSDNLAIDRIGACRATQNEACTSNAQEPPTLLSFSTAAECSKLGPDRAFGFGLASLGLPQGIVKNSHFVA